MADRDEIRARLERSASGLASLLDTKINTLAGERVGFALLLFDFVPTGQEGWMTWISNAQRADMLRTLEEMVARFRRDELGGPPAGDVEDVAAALINASGVDAALGIKRAHVLAMAAAAIALGASPGLARAVGNGAPGLSDERDRAEVPRG